MHYRLVVSAQVLNVYILKFTSIVIAVYIGVQKWLARVWKLVGVLVNRSATESPPPPPDSDQLQHWEDKIKEFRNAYLQEVGVTVTFNH